MIKKISISILVVLIIIFITGCINNKTNNIKKENKITNGEISTMKIIINNEEYIVNLENNKTVQELVKILPNKLQMNELNGNEKYAYLEKSLPTDSSVPKEINKGDIMLFGNDCLVIFYKSFDTTYSYTKIGHIDNLPDLGNNSIEVEFII